MFKVAFFADILSKDFDGASRTMYQLISRIDRQRFSFYFVTGHNKMAKDEGLTVLETPAWNIPLQKRYKISLPFLKNKTVRKQLDEFAPDVIHISTPSLLGIWAIRYASRRNLPVISIFHTYFSSYMDYYFKAIPFLPALLRRFTNWYQKWFYNHCSKVYVPSETMRSELISIGVDEERIKIWERGIDRNLFHPSNADPHYFKTITNNGQKNILFVSRLVWEKNLTTLMKVYKGIVEKNLPYNFIVVGSGHAEDKIKREMPGAHFLGDLTHKELSAIYASADVLLFPSISETFGNVVLEGLSSGLPCIVANKGGTKDMIRHGYNGFICRHDDAEDYIGVIRELLSDEARFQKMKEDAYQSSLKYDWTSLAQRYFDDVTELASARKTKDSPH